MDPNWGEHASSWGLLVGSKLHVGQQCVLEAREVNCILVCSRKIITSSLRDVILPFYSALVKHICSVGSSSGLPNTRKSQTS